MNDKCRMDSSGAVSVDWEALVATVGDTLDPEQVFTGAELSAWAERNGWTKEAE